MDDRRNSGQTVLLFDEDAYIKDFKATVISCSVNEDKQYMVVLDQTAFFPEGGGQSCDTGTIGEAKVSKVATINGEVIHFTDMPLNKGEGYDCHIDFETRYDRMQNHSGEHLLCGIIHNMFGCDNVGFHLGDETTTLDVDKELTEEQLRMAELKANRVIYENVPIVVSFPDSDTLKFLDYRSKLDITEGVRIVEIVGYDKCACCAPHVKHTGEIGCIKIIDAFPHRGGTRITILAGERAFRDYHFLNSTNKLVMGLLSAKRLDTGNKIIQLNEKNQKLTAENVRLEKELTALLSEKVKKEISERANGDLSTVTVFSEGFSEVQMRNLINDCLLVFDGAVAGFMGNDEAGYRYIIGAHKEKGILYKNELIALPVFSKEMNQTLNGRGGGSPMMIQGSVSATEMEIRKFFMV